MPKDVSKLIPIKKPITDIQKGLIIRTYYYRPQTLLKQLEKLKQDPNINYFTETPFYNEYQTYLKTGDKSSFAKYFDDNTWNLVSNINFNPEINNTSIPSKLSYQTSSYLFSGDSIFLKDFKKNLREMSKEKKLVPIEYKYKSKKTFTNPYKEVMEYNVVKSANLLSNMVNFYNPRKPKVVSMVKKLIGSDFIDDSGIIHHCVFSERTINRERDLFLNILRSNINIFYSTMMESRKDTTFLMKYMPYFLTEIFKLDVNEFTNILKTYYFLPIISEFRKEIKKNTIYSDNVSIFYAKLVNAPKEELIKYIKENFIDNNKYNFDFDTCIIHALPMRNDITHREYDVIMETYLKRYDIFDLDSLVSNMIDFFFNNNPPSLFLLIYLYCLHQHFKLIPIYFAKDFLGCPSEYGSILFMLLNNEKVKAYLLNNVIPIDIVEKNTDVFIPIIKKGDDQFIDDNIITFRLLNFHLACLDDIELKNKYCYVKIPVKRYLKISKYNNYVIIF